MKIFEQRQENGSRKLMGTTTNDVANAVEVDLKTADGTTSKFDFTKQYHYVAPGSFAVNGTETALGMYIGNTRVVPPANIDFEEEVTMTSIEVTTKPTKLAYTEGEALDLTGMVVTLIGTDGTQEITETLGVDEYLTTPVNGAILTTDPTGEIEVVVSAYDFEDSFTITVTASTEEPGNGNA